MLVGQVNDAVLTGGNTLVSCSSDTTVKVCAICIYFLILFSYTDKNTLFVRVAYFRYGMGSLMEHVPGHFINTLTMLLAWQQQRKMYCFWQNINILKK